MTPKTAPYRLLRPCLGFPVGSILIGYLWPGGRLEILGNGNREFVEPGTAEPYVHHVAEVVEAKPTAREEEYQEAKP